MGRQAESAEIVGTVARCRRVNTRVAGLAGYGLEYLLAVERADAGVYPRCDLE